MIAAVLWLVLVASTSLTGVQGAGGTFVEQGTTLSGTSTLLSPACCSHVTIDSVHVTSGAGLILNLTAVAEAARRNRSTAVTILVKDTTVDGNAELWIVGNNGIVGSVCYWLVAVNITVINLKVQNGLFAVSGLSLIGDGGGVDAAFVIINSLFQRTDDRLLSTTNVRWGPSGSAVPSVLSLGSSPGQRVTTAVLFTNLYLFGATTSLTVSGCDFQCSGTTSTIVGSLTYACAGMLLANSKSTVDSTISDAARMSIAGGNTFTTSHPKYEPVGMLLLTFMLRLVSGGELQLSGNTMTSTGPVSTSTSVAIAGSSWTLSKNSTASIMSNAMTSTSVSDSGDGVKMYDGSIISASENSAFRIESNTMVMSGTTGANVGTTGIYTEAFSILLNTQSVFSVRFNNIQCKRLSTAGGAYPIFFFGTVAGKPFQIFDSSVFAVDDNVLTGSRGTTGTGCALASTMSVARGGVVSVSRNTINVFSDGFGQGASGIILYSSVITVSEYGALIVKGNTIGINGGSGAHALGITHQQSANVALYEGSTYTISANTISLRSASGSTGSMPFQLFISTISLSNKSLATSKFAAPSTMLFTANTISLVSSSPALPFVKLDTGGSTTSDSNYNRFIISDNRGTGGSSSAWGGNAPSGKHPYVLMRCNAVGGVTLSSTGLASTSVVGGSPYPCLATNVCPVDVPTATCVLGRSSAVEAPIWNDVTGECDCFCAAVAASPIVFGSPVSLDSKCTPVFSGALPQPMDRATTTMLVAGPNCALSRTRQWTETRSRARDTGTLSPSVVITATERLIPSLSASVTPSVAITASSVVSDSQTVAPTDSPTYSASARATPSSTIQATRSQYSNTTSKTGSIVSLSPSVRIRPTRSASPTATRTSGTATASAWLTVTAENMSASTTQTPALIATQSETRTGTSPRSVTLESEATRSKLSSMSQASSSRSPSRSPRPSLSLAVTLSNPFERNVRRTPKDPKWLKSADATLGVMSLVAGVAMPAAIAPTFATRIRSMRRIARQVERCHNLRTAEMKEDGSFDPDAMTAEAPDPADVLFVWSTSSGDDALSLGRVLAGIINCVMFSALGITLIGLSKSREVFLQVSRLLDRVRRLIPASVRRVYSKAAAKDAPLPATEEGAPPTPAQESAFLERWMSARGSVGNVALIINGYFFPTQLSLSVGVALYRRASTLVRVGPGVFLIVFGIACHYVFALFAAWRFVGPQAAPLEFDAVDVDRDRAAGASVDATKPEVTSAASDAATPSHSVPFGDVAWNYVATVDPAKDRSRRIVGLLYFEDLGVAMVLALLSCLPVPCGPLAMLMFIVCLFHFCYVSLFVRPFDSVAEQRFAAVSSGLLLLASMIAIAFTWDGVSDDVMATLESAMNAIESLMLALIPTQLVVLEVLQRCSPDNKNKDPKRVRLRKPLPPTAAVADPMLSAEEGDGDDDDAEDRADSSPGSSMELPPRRETVTPVLPKWRLLGVPVFQPAGQPPPRSHVLSRLKQPGNRLISTTASTDDRQRDKSYQPPSWWSSPASRAAPPRAAGRSGLPQYDDQEADEAEVTIAMHDRYMQKKRRSISQLSTASSHGSQPHPPRPAASRSLPASLLPPDAHQPPKPRTAGQTLNRLRGVRSGGSSSDEGSSSNEGSVPPAQTNVEDDPFYVRADGVLTVPASQSTTARRRSSNPLESLPPRSHRWMLPAAPTEMDIHLTPKRPPPRTYLPDALLKPQTPPTIPGDASSVAVLSRLRQTGPSALSV